MRQGSWGFLGSYEDPKKYITYETPRARPHECTYILYRPYEAMREKDLDPQMGSGSLVNIFGFVTLLMKPP